MILRVFPIFQSLWFFFPQVSCECKRATKEDTNFNWWQRINACRHDPKAKWKDRLKKRLEKGGTPRCKTSRRGQTETNLRRSRVSNHAVTWFKPSRNTHTETGQPKMSVLANTQPVELFVCISEAGRQWQGYVNRTIVDNETGEVKNECKSHKPQNWGSGFWVCWALAAVLNRRAKRLVISRR